MLAENLRQEISVSAMITAQVIWISAGRILIVSPAWNCSNDGCRMDAGLCGLEAIETYENILIGPDGLVPALEAAVAYNPQHRDSISSTEWAVFLRTYQTLPVESGKRSLRWSYCSGYIESKENRIRTQQFEQRAILGGDRGLHGVHNPINNIYRAQLLASVLPEDDSNQRTWSGANDCVR
jgi:hypothetical protein